ncbi:CYTH and CHAD domain-containing protein [Actinocorallia populi]|uniref:CYTH and CHAD domain-containing protein n=1 Tax=Actinocorallia populi TaxID=2079200 RepID=UPI0018E55E71|nr:CYTH and CHAD domain-containing protein [Actinocorallia populi]
MTEHLEVELKFDADSGFVLPDLSDLAAVGEPVIHELEAVYHDTDDLRLAARKLTLRRRTGGTDAGWHLKIPAGPDAKREHRAPLSDSLPAELAGLLHAYVRGREVRPVATLTTVRTVRELRSPSGEVLAEVADDLVTGTIAGTPGGSSWREIEVELVSGDPALLAEVGSRLHEAGARRSAGSSKLGRLLASRIAAPPAWDGPRAGDALLRHLAAQVDDLLSWDPRVRLEQFDAVHKMRVAVRRLRSVLASGRPLLDRAVTDPLQPELRWLAAVLGEVRDAEVLHERFSERLASLPEVCEADPAWLRRIKKRERKGYAAVREELSGERYFTLLDALDRLLAAPPFTKRAHRDAEEELRALLRRSWRRLENAHAAIGEAPSAEEADEARHETRKAAKRVRYTADAVQEVLGKDARTVSKAAKSLQEVLGRFQDGVIAQEQLRAVKPASVQEAFGLGALYGLEHCEAGRARDEVEAAWADARALALPRLG